MAAPIRPNPDLFVDEMQFCIQNCLECHEECLRAIVFCLNKGGRHADAKHIRILMDCAEICQVSANFMQKGSPFHHLTCEVTASIAEICAEDCERLGSESEMVACAQSCRRCAESCRKMSGALRAA